jgi:hypothetical protein
LQQLGVKVVAPALWLSCFQLCRCRFAYAGDDIETMIAAVMTGAGLQHWVGVIFLVDAVSVVSVLVMALVYMVMSAKAAVGWWRLTCCWWVATMRWGGGACSGNGVCRCVDGAGDGVG